MSAHGSSAELAESTLQTASDAERLALVSAGEDFIRQLKDASVDPASLAATAADAVARGDFVGMLAARDERGRSPLHVAATRGDVGLCREMLRADPGLVDVRDARRSTAIMEASLLGRALIVEELVAAAADVRAKNADCMNALQLACVNEGAGNGAVVESLIRAGADPAEFCWQVSPLMAAADSGHVWALQVLIDMGADPWLMNGSHFTALDYARDQESAEFLYGLMQGDKLSSRPAPRFDAQRLFKDAETRRANLHRASRLVPLEDALQILECPPEWLQGFRESGEHFGEIKKKWRRICLQCHPDKQPDDLESDEMAAASARFQDVVAAFEALERHFRSLNTDVDNVQ